MKKMKKFSLWALVLMLSAITFQSCKEDIVADEGQLENNTNLTARGAGSSISKLTYTDRFGNKQEILNFATTAVYKSTVDDLEKKYDASSDLENEYEALLDFDSNHHFNALLQDYVNAEDKWLMTEDLPEATDPDVLFDAIDVSELALLNKDSAVIIAGQILIYFNHTYGIIRDGDISHINELLSIGIATTNRIKLPDWVYVYDEPNDSCKLRNRFSNYFTEGNKQYKLLAKCKASSGLTGSHALIKLSMRAFKKRRWIGWKKIKAHMAVELNGNVGEESCSLTRSFDHDHDYFPEYTKRLVHKWYSADSQFYMQYRELFEKFYLDGNLKYTVDLYDKNWR